MNSLGEKLKSLRIKNGLTQNMLAQKLFISNRSVSHWEKGIRFPDFETIQKIAKILNVPLDYFSQNESYGESAFSNLIVVKNEENKLAIYDKEKSIYLTIQDYDIIRLSPYGIHICEKCKIIDEKRKIDFDKCINTNGFDLGYQDTKIDLVDNFGNIKSFRRPQYLFYMPFNCYKVAPVFIKNENRFALVNRNLTCLTKEKFGKIWDSGIYGAGLYFTFLMNEEKLKALAKHSKDIDDYDLYEKDNIPRMLINSRGEIIFDNLGLNFRLNKFDALPLDSIEIAIEYLNKFGLGLLYFVNDLVFEKFDNVIKFLDIVCRYKNEDKMSTFNDLFYNNLVEQIFLKKLGFCKDLNNKESNIIYNKILEVFSTENRVEKAKIQRLLDKQFNK